MRRPLVAGNWKMNGTQASVNSLLSELQQQSLPLGIDLVLFPGFLHVSRVVAKLASGKNGWEVGGQTCALEAGFGAITGEVSANQLVDAGCKWVLVGHSERRILMGETDDAVGRKCYAAQLSGLKPVICVGETQEEYQAGQSIAVVEKQLEAVLNSCEISADWVIAYEPVWAIGTGLTATPSWAQEVHKAIRTKLAEKNAERAAQIRILYGGSVKASNAAELFSMQDIDGGLVGGASLFADEFSAICRAAGN